MKAALKFLGVKRLVLMAVLAMLPVAAFASACCAGLCCGHCPFC